jgi:molybdate transport system regulatory protein
MKLVYKIWIDQSGKAFGDGPLALLKGVEQTDSLNRSAAKMGMSYSKAWGLIRTLEGRLGFPLLERKVGGPSGGGSKLTSEAREWVARYEGLRRDVDQAMETLFEKHFGPLKGRSRKEREDRDAPDSRRRRGRRRK